MSAKIILFPQEATKARREERKAMDAFSEDLRATLLDIANPNPGPEVIRPEDRWFHEDI